MKIAFVSQYYFPEPFSNSAIAHALIKMGHEVEVLTGVPNYPGGVFYEGYSNQEKRFETHDGIDIHRVYSHPRGRSALSLIINYLIFMIAGSIGARFLKLKTPDIVLCSQLSPVLSCIPALVLARRFKVPVVFWVQDIWPESATFTLGIKSPLLVKPLTWVSGWIYRRADLLLVQSEAFPPMLTRFGVPGDIIRVFPNTAPEGFQPISPSEAPTQGDLIPKDGFRLMFAGNIGESQDFDTIIETARMLRDKTTIHWIVLGSGRDMARVQSLICEAGLEDVFYFLGRHPEADMPKFFAHADAMLVSLKDTPIFALTVPYKVQCYMACGRPIVASLDGEGARIINAAGAGVTAPAGEPNQLAEQILTLVNLPKKAHEEMAANARTHFDAHYDADLIFSNLDTWLKEVANTPD